MAILDLKVQRDRLVKYQKQIELIISKETNLVKQLLVDGRKNKALLLMKKKKYQEKLLEQTDAQLLNLEQMVNSIEYSLVERKIIEGLKHGNQILAVIHKETSLEDVEKLMQDTADAISYQNEIEKMLGCALSDDEEHDLLQDLELIIQKQSEDITSKIPSTKDLSELDSKQKTRTQSPISIPIS